MSEQEKPQGETPQPRRIKDVMFEALVRDGVTDTQEVLRRIYAEFPQANSGPKDVAWYRWQFREKGLLEAKGKLTAEQRKARKAEYEAQYKAKQAAVKQARREAAMKLAAEAERARIEALVEAEVARRLAEIEK